MTYREKAIERLTSIGITDVSLMEEIIDLMTNDYYTSLFVDFERESDWNKKNRICIERRELIMRGKQLTLEEVLNLEDGSKVWVEDSREYLDSAVCKYDEKFNYLRDIYDDKYHSHYDLNEIQYYDAQLDFYEWIDDLIIPDKIEAPYYSQDTVESMAYEIAKYRYPNKYEYDGELIEKIIEEFS